MSYHIPASLTELVQAQHGVVTRSQARSAGLAPDQIKSKVVAGRWQRLHSGVYATFTGTPDRAARLWAAVLRAGDGAMLSYQSAAELDHLIDQPAPLIHVTVPASRRIMPIKGVVVHTRLAAERAMHPVRTPPRTRIEETVLDLAESCTDVCDAIHWITSAVGRGLTTQELLRFAMNKRSRIRWRAEIRSVLEPDQAGLHSALEYRYVHAVEAPHGFPKSKRQVRSRRNGPSVYRDVLYEEYALVVELDGQVAHPGDRRWLDIRRDNAAAADGILTLRYGYRDLTATPCLVAVQLEQVLKARGWQGSARRCSARCAIAV